MQITLGKILPTGKLSVEANASNVSSQGANAGGLL